MLGLRSRAGRCVSIRQAAGALLLPFLLCVTPGFGAAAAGHTQRSGHHQPRPAAASHRSSQVQSKSDDQWETFADDDHALLSNKIKRAIDRRNRRRKEGCFGCGEHSHLIADCPNMEKTDDHSSSRRKGSSRDRKSKGGKYGKKDNKYKNLKKATHAFFASRGNNDSDSSSTSSLDFEDEKPKKIADAGLCFIADLKGGM